MEGALRLISVERGHDPGGLALVAFGGAGPLHAAELARRLGVPSVLVPPAPGTLSARGILVADIRKDVARTVLRTGDDAALEALLPDLERLEATARRELEDEGIDPASIRVDRMIDARYEGQSYELGVPADDDWVDAFHAAHERRFGFSRSEAPVEAVTLRVEARAAVPRPVAETVPDAESPATPERSTAAYLDGARRDVPLYDRERLLAGHGLDGPAIVGEYSSTTWIPDGWRARVTGTGDLVLTEAR